MMSRDRFGECTVRDILLNLDPCSLSIHKPDKTFQSQGEHYAQKS